MEGIVSTRPRPLILLLVAAMSAFLALGAAPASAATTATLTGSVQGIREASPAINGPVAGVRASAVDASTGVFMKSVYTDTAGKYLITGLSAGTYKVKLYKPGWLVTWYPTNLVLASGATKDLGPTVIHAEAVIAGQVLSWSDPIGGARVTVFDAITGKGVAAVIADGDGNYRIGQLPAGSFKVRATKSGYQEAWANYPATTYGKATVYRLVSGQELRSEYPTVLYLDLAPLAAIEGSVFGFSDIDASGEMTGCAGDWDDPLGDVRVSAVDATTGVFLKSVYTDSLGKYRIEGLKPGTFKVKFLKPCWTVAWYPEIVPLMSGGTASLAEFVMYGEMAITGQVMEFDADAQPPVTRPSAGARVTVVDATTGRVVAAAWTDSDGKYRISNLPGGGQGSFKVRATKDQFYTGWVGPIDMSAGYTRTQNFEILICSSLRTCGPYYP